MNKSEKENEILSEDLQKAIFDNDIDDVEGLLQNGAVIANRMVIDQVARKRNCVSLLKLVEKYGYDLTQRGHIALFQSALSTKTKNVEFLIQKVAEKDSRVVYLCLVNLNAAYMENSEKTKPIVDLLVPHITQDGLFKIFDALKEKKSAKEYIDYVQQSWLVANLKINEVRVKQPKI